MRVLKSSTVFDRMQSGSALCQALRKAKTDAHMIQRRVIRAFLSVRFSYYYLICFISLIKLPDCLTDRFYSTDQWLESQAWFKYSVIIHRMHNIKHYVVGPLSSKKTAFPGFWHVWIFLIRWRDVYRHSVRVSQLSRRAQKLPLPYTQDRGGSHSVASG